jgi:NADH-quinone oxidoreductase subunit N
LVGLAGLPPGLAGLFAKVVVVRSLLVGGAGWLALVVAVNAVIGLAYYVRVSALMYAPASGSASAEETVSPAGPGWPVSAALAAATGLAIVVGFAPQLVLDLAGR